MEPRDAEMRDSCYSRVRVNLDAAVLTMGKGGLRLGEPSEEPTRRMLWPVECLFTSA
jgi:hypothetical protein